MNYPSPFGSLFVLLASKPCGVLRQIDRVFCLASKQEFGRGVEVFKHGRLSNNRCVSDVLLFQYNHPPKTIARLQYYACYDRGLHILNEYCSGWRGSTSIKLANIGGIPFVINGCRATRPCLCLSGFVSVIFHTFFRLGLGKCTYSERYRAWLPVVRTIHVHRQRIGV